MKAFNAWKAKLLPTPPDAASDEGQLYFKSDGNLYKKIGSSPESMLSSANGSVLAMSAGMMFVNMSGNTPSGTLLCDGSVVSRTTYAALFNAIGTTFNTGGEASTDFRLPDLKGRVPVGRDTNQTEFDVLGETGGAKTHTLTESQMPSHTHALNLAVWVQNSGYGTVNATGSTNANRANASGANNASTGGGQPHNNLQPYIVGQWVITTGGAVGSAAEASTTRRGTWSGSVSTGNFTQSVSFAQPYPSGVVPVVTASLMNANLDWLYGPSIQTVTNTGFTFYIKNGYSAAITAGISYQAST